MRPVRILTTLILLAAIYDVCACMLTHINPLGSIAIAVLAGSSLALLDWVEAEHNRRIREERVKQWARREREGFGL